MLARFWSGTVAHDPNDQRGAAFRAAETPRAADGRKAAGGDEQSHSEAITRSKLAVAHAVCDRVVQSGMIVGLGTGSTAIHAVRRIGERLAAGEISNVVGVATSFESTIEAQRLGIPLCTLNDPAARDGIDLAIDGADEVEVATGYLIKGGGGALTREKLVEYSSRRLYVVVDESKLSNRLGTLFRIPVEVIPDALAAARRDLRKLGLEPELRMAVQKAGPVVTDNGNLILDCRVPTLPIDPPVMERAINAIPGVLDNGIFAGVETEVWVGRADGSVERVERQP